MPQRQSHLFVENSCQGQRLWAQLHTADSHRIRGLQRMASLHSPLALAATAHRDIETAHDGPADNFFLILGFAAFPLHAAATMRAALRQWNGDPFIHARRDGAARLPAVAATGFAAWLLRVVFWVAPRVRGSLTL